MSACLSVCQYVSLSLCLYACLFLVTCLVNLIPLLLRHTWSSWRDEAIGIDVMLTAPFKQAFFRFDSIQLYIQRTLNGWNELEEEWIEGARLGGGCDVWTRLEWMYTSESRALWMNGGGWQDKAVTFITSHMYILHVCHIHHICTCGMSVSTKTYHFQCLLQKRVRDTALQMRWWWSRRRSGRIDCCCWRRRARCS